MELLAPAGSREALIAAVESGADAVYLAGSSFGARAYADNFDREALKAAIRFAHLRGVAVHVTVNTIIADSELAEAEDYLRFLSAAGADAVLVQDLGVAMLARRVVPELPLHASTQMTVHNLAGVLALAELGFTRVVLSRELSLKDIRYICEHSPVEIEVFIHGALCVCYSGQCLMSSMIGGRSGNRGRCAQPCRLPYKLVDEKGKGVPSDAGEFILSPRDLKTIEILPELKAAGVASLKIEGRMKRAEYVSVVVDTYRKAVDGIDRETGYAVPVDAERRLAQIFNRDFTTAYLLSRPGRRMMSDLRPNNRGLLVGRVTAYDRERQLASVKLSADIHQGDELDFWVKVGGRSTITVTELFDDKRKKIAEGKSGQVVFFPLKANVREHDRVFRVYDVELMAEAGRRVKTGAAIRRIPVDAEFFAAVGRKPRFSLLTDDGVKAEAEVYYVAPAATSRPLNEATVRKQLLRMGGTVYEPRELKINIAGEPMVPVSVLNELRRKATEKLDELRLAKWSRGRLASPVKTAWDENSPLTYDLTPKSGIIVSVDSIEQMKAAVKNGADAILFGGDSYHHRAITAADYRMAAQIARESKVNIYFNTPRIVREEHLPGLRVIWEKWRDISPKAVYVHNIGTLRIMKEMGFNIRTDYSLITYNHLTVEALRRIGVTGVTLSPELTLEQILRLDEMQSVQMECIVHGPLELMISEYCALGSFLGGLGEAGKGCSQPCRGRNFGLKDRKGEIFPIVTDQFCHMHILNAKTLSFLPHIGELAGLGIALRIEGKSYTPTELGKTVEMYREIFSRGKRLTEEETEWCRSLEGNDITRGHYFRGVL